MYLDLFSFFKSANLTSGRPFVQRLCWFQDGTDISCLCFYAFVFVICAFKIYAEIFAGHKGLLTCVMYKVFFTKVFFSQVYPCWEYLIPLPVEFGVSVITEFQDIWYFRAIWPRKVFYWTETSTWKCCSRTNEKNKTADKIGFTVLGFNKS